MDESTKNKAKGTWEEAKGKARKQFGEFQGKLDDLTDDDKRDKPS